MKMGNKTLYYCPSKKAICTVEYCANGKEIKKYPSISTNFTSCDYGPYTIKRSHPDDTKSLFNFEDGTERTVYGTLEFKERGCEDISPTCTYSSIEPELVDIAIRRANLCSEVDDLNTQIQDLEERRDQIQDALKRINSQQEKLIEESTRNEYSDFITTLNKIQDWTVKSEYILDLTKPKVKISVSTINLIDKVVYVYWLYESASNKGRSYEQSVSFSEFIKKFEPYQAPSKTWKENSLVEEAHSEGNKLYLCNHPYGYTICKTGNCTKGKELSSIIFSEPGNKSSWYDFRGYAYMSDSIELNFVHGKKMVLTNIDSFKEGCELNND